MPTLTKSTPKYRKHKASGQAVVTLCGKDHYLGPWGSRASKAEYDRLVGEWLAAGRPTVGTTAANGLSMVELLNAYNKFAQQHYRKDGNPSREYLCVRSVLKKLRRLYGSQSVSSFGPLSLKALRQHMIDEGLARSTINMNVGRIKRMFRWAVSEELVPVETYQALATVAGLQQGRSKARETDPIAPIDDGSVDTTLPHLPSVVADMVRFQRLTGCRPGEVCAMRPADLDTTREVWEFRPRSHKTAHHGRTRVIFIGPKAQAILRPYLLRPEESFCFAPSDSERKRLGLLHERRTTPLNQGNRPGTNRRSRPKRTAGRQYTNDSYRRAIHRACDAAFPPPPPLVQLRDETTKEWNRRLSPSQRDELAEWQSLHRWSPNQLRHTAGTEIRRLFGLEAVQVTLGHARADVTQIYAERDWALAARVMKEVG